MVSTRRTTEQGSPPAKSARKTATKTKSVPRTSKNRSTKQEFLCGSESVPREDARPFFSFEDPEYVQKATLIRRPSRRNRSPYVADICLVNDGREALCHVPNLDMGGNCVPGVTLLVRPARTSKGGMLVGPHAVHPKYGTPKCEFIAQLLLLLSSSSEEEEKEGVATPIPPPSHVWVGAHPKLGEQIAERLFLENRLVPALPRMTSFQREVRVGTEMRADFLLTFADTRRCVLEVKTVVDTDYCTGRVPTTPKKCLFVSPHPPDQYRRAAIFPWGQSKQTGPDGERVVSARAIKHVRELTRLAKDDEHNIQAAILFIVIRKDAKVFRPNHEACPSFCRYLQEARDAGVTILAKRVDWCEDAESLGQCLEGPLLDIEWPSL